jgi:hypothetical protein
LQLRAALLAAATLPSDAEISIRIDMNRITRGRYLEYTPEDRDFVRFWLSGYYNAAANSSILNYDRFQRQPDYVSAYCGST